jgi:hypothetical protein
MLEFLVAWANNFRVVFIILMVGAAFGIVGTAIWAMNQDDTTYSDKADRLTSKQWFRRMVLLFALFGVFGSIPGPDDLWHIRLSFLKLELASPENVKAVGGHVDAIVKMLECKHLNVNCAKEEKK